MKQQQTTDELMAAIIAERDGIARDIDAVRNRIGKLSNLTNLLGELKDFTTETSTALENLSKFMPTPIPEPTPEPVVEISETNQHGIRTWPKKQSKELPNLEPGTLKAKVYKTALKLGTFKVADLKSRIPDFSHHGKSYPSVVVSELKKAGYLTHDPEAGTYSVLQ